MMNMTKEKTKELYNIFEEENIFSSPDRFIQVWFALEGFLRGKTVWYDMEAVEDDSSYKDLFLMHAKTFKDEMRISRSSCSSFYDRKNRKAGISLKIGEETLESSWDQSSDWVEPAFYEFIRDKVEPRILGAFVSFVPIDQGYYGMYLPKDQAKRIDSKLRELESRLELDEYY